ncbi:hypothetical protein EXIGLDRAFT_349240, partial [Exidia glandulosa HHB12029]
MSENIVYLEDLAPPKDASAPTTKLTKTSAAAAAKAGDKRQRTLLDFTQAKRRKTDGDSASSTSSTPTKTTGSFFMKSGSTSPQKLNSIPFSLNNFVNSLSEEERGLLQLECESLNLVWLKMLQDEVRKKYFLDLKRWLHQEGL